VTDGARRATAVAAIVAGVALRIVLVAEKPLWSDEIFTLTLARGPVAAILEALRSDSGPPLHYLLAHAVLAPFGSAPGGHDVAVRLISLLASLLHLPLLVLVARRCGRPEAGLPAAALYSLFPLAADYAAEGRAYALASLLVLLAVERALSLREASRPGAAVALTLAAAAAVWSHYLAIFPLAGIAALVPGTPRASRNALLGGLAAAAGLFLPWLPVALRQPAASMAWSQGGALANTPLQVPVNLAFGLTPPEGTLAIFVPLSLLLLAAILLAGWKGALRPAVLVLAVGLPLLLAGHFLVRTLLLPERPAVLFLPYVALLLAGAPRPAAVLSALASLAGLVLLARAAVRPSPGEALLNVLLPLVREGRTVCAAGLVGPELDYRLARAGLPGRVVLFPSDVARHRGWLDEAQLSPDRLAVEARGLLSSPSRPRLFVLPKGSRASAALGAALGPAQVPVASNVLVDVVEVPEVIAPGR